MDLTAWEADLRQIRAMTDQQIRTEMKNTWEEYRRLRRSISDRSESPQEIQRRKFLWSKWDKLRTELTIREDRQISAERTARMVRENANLGAKFRDRTFQNFIASRAQDAYDACREYAETDAAISQGVGILLWGKQGVGKTHLAAAMANVLLERGVMVLFDTYVNHLNKLKQEFNSKGERRYLDRIKKVPVLVIDDIGKERQTEWTQSVLFDVINHRYEHKLPVIVTTNLGPTQLEAYLDKAVYSRLCEMTRSLRMIGSDFRRTKA